MAFLKWLLTKTIPAGRLFGIPLRVHLLMVLFLPFLAWSLTSPGLGFLFNALYCLIYIGILYFSVLAHEFGHAWGCRLVQGRTEQIILTPVGGLHVGTGGMESPRSELIVVALGPAVSILFAAIGWIALKLTDHIIPQNEWAYLGLTAIWAFAAINLMLTLFNLLFPLFPLDSARLIRAGFSLRHNPQLVTMRVCNVGLALGVLVLIAGFVGIEIPYFGRVGIFLVIIAVIGMQTCYYEKKRIEIDLAYARSDDWGKGPIYYDQELVDGAKQRAREDLRRLIPFRSPKETKPASPQKAPLRKAPAKIIDIEPIPDPQTVTDIGELNRHLRQAVEAEDFHTAARIKRRLEDLTR